MREIHQRRVLLDEMHRAARHIGAMSVYERVQKRIPQISFGAVYRNLKVMRENGLVREIALARRASLWERASGPHYHFACNACGEVFDVPLEFDRGWERAVADSTGFAVTEHRAEFFGLCDKCKRRANDRRSRRR